MLPRLLLTIGLCFMASGTLAYGDDPLASVYAHIDAAARSFKGVSADIVNTQHTALVDSDEVESGTFKLGRVKSGQTALLISLGPQFISLNAQEGKLFNPKTNTVDVKSLADKQSVVNQLLELGFGASSAELKAAYDITYVGEEKVGSQQTSHLKLVPKSPDTRRTLRQADLWYADTGLAAQQKFLYPAGDYKLVKYSNVKLGAIPEKDLQIPLPKNVTVQKH